MRRQRYHLMIVIGSWKHERMTTTIDCCNQTKQTKPSFSSPFRISTLSSCASPTDPNQFDTWDSVSVTAQIQPKMQKMWSKLRSHNYVYPGLNVTDNTTKNVTDGWQGNTNCCLVCAAFTFPPLLIWWSAQCFMHLICTFFPQLTFFVRVFTQAFKCNS